MFLYTHFPERENLTPHSDTLRIAGRNEGLFIFDQVDDLLFILPPEDG